MTERLRVSVRALVERALRAGDLNLEGFQRSSPVDGIRAHQRLQASRGEGYQKEVSVSRSVEAGGVVLEVHGRIDGVWERGGGVLVEEIKTTRGDLDACASRSDPVHWGQLQVYALSIAEERGLDAVDARLTYYQLETGRSVELDRRFALEDLRKLFDELVARHLRGIARRSTWREERDASILELEFPHSAYRAGQREMAVTVYRALRDRERVLVQAPTGIGKTLGSVYPAAKAIGSGQAARFLYLTARTTGRSLAERALEELRGRGLRMRSVTLTAKDKICFNPEKACNGEECGFARGFYDRVEAAVEEGLGQTALTRDAIEALGRKHQVCPFELSHELARDADAVICDYNHVFDPRASLRHLQDAEAEPFVLLVDEAHNLVDRAREMYSAELRKTPFLALRRALDRGPHAALRRSIGALDRAFLELRRRAEASGGAFTDRARPDALLSRLERFVRECEAALSDPTLALETRRLVLDRFFESVRFVNVAQGWSDAYRACLEGRERELRVKLFCIDPAAFLAETLARASASVFFSATLTPPSYFTRLLGAGDETRKLRFASPFPSDRLQVVLATHVATRLRRRRESEPELTRLLIELVKHRPGKYLLYFPSYAYLAAVHERFVREHAGVDVAVQSPTMSESERDAFLARFHDGEGDLVGFAVLGGFFGEGIDLPGDRLTGVAIVGVGLPAVSPENEEIRDHFHASGLPGFDYAYVYPGVNRVLQAAGRVIRSETDRGTVLLVDERFAERRYRSLLPPEWSPVVVRSTSELERALEAFWSSPAVASA